MHTRKQIHRYIYIYTNSYHKDTHTGTEWKKESVIDRFILRHTNHKYMHTHMNKETRKHSDTNVHTVM